MGHDTTPDQKDAVASADAAPITDEAAEAAAGGKTWGYGDVMRAMNKAQLGDSSEVNQLFKDLAPKPATESPRIATMVEGACPVQMSGGIGGRFDKP